MNREFARHLHLRCILQVMWASESNKRLFNWKKRIIKDCLTVPYLAVWTLNILWSANTSASRHLLLLQTHKDKIAEKGECVWQDSENNSIFDLVHFRLGRYYFLPNYFCWSFPVNISEKAMKTNMQSFPTKGQWYFPWQGDKHSQAKEEEFFLVEAVVSLAWTKTWPTVPYFHICEMILMHLGSVLSYSLADPAHYPELLLTF